MSHGLRRPGKPAAAVDQLEVEQEVLAVVQPLRVATAALERAAAEGHRAAAGQEGRWVDVIHQRQGRCAQGKFERAPRVGLKEAGHRVLALAQLLRWHVGERRGQPLQPVRREAHTGIGAGDDVAAAALDRQVATAADVRAPRLLQLQRQPVGVAQDDRRRAVAAAAVDDYHLVGRARLSQQAVQQPAHGRRLVEHSTDDRDTHGGIIPIQPFVVDISASRRSCPR